MKLTREERRIQKWVESGKYESIPITPEKMREIKAAAAYTLAQLKKDARLSIRISSSDLKSLRQIAAEEGLPYQTYVSSVLHKHIRGRLVEKKGKS